MSAVKRRDRPIHYPGHTVWGDVHGPVVEVGDVIRGNETLRGVTVYLNERELNEACIGMWGEGYKQLQERANRIGESNAQLQDRVAVLEEKLEQAQEQKTAADLVAAALETMKET